MYRPHARSLVVLFLLSLSALLCAWAANPYKGLSPVYRHWIEAEVPYIITTEERNEFLTLKTDAERDSFIESFWKIRNPDPNSNINTYKEEHYRRLAYANENFGDPRYADGWRSDRGKMYIILGAPKQRAQYHETANLRPMEIWFFQTETPALPPYFYLLFYKQSAGEDYKLYSPKFDGPVSLCSTGETRNDPDRALGIIRKSLGAEVAKTAVTLLPNEHADIQSFEPSMASDALLVAINDLPDNPVTKERLEANRMRERVTTSLFLGENDTTLSYEVFRDDFGRMTLNYLLNMKFADAHVIGTRKDNSNYYDLTLRTEVLSTSGKQIYAQEDQITGNLTTAQAEDLKKKRFGAEARLPLTPGNYILVTTLTNNIDKTATRQRATVTVPAVNNTNISISGLLAYTTPAAIPAPGNRLPFSASHYRFTPRGAQNVYIRQGERLPLVFQLWLDPRTSVATTKENIHLRYIYGSVAASRQDASQENEDVDAGNRDRAGNLLTGHTLNTASLAPGVYQVVVSATRGSEQKTAYATLNLHVAADTNYIDTWTAYASTDTGGETVDDFKRGLSAEAQGADIEAILAYRRALAEGSNDMHVLDNLAVLLARNGSTELLADLSKELILTKAAANPSTLLAISGALSKGGNYKAIIRMLDFQLTLQPPNVDVYNTLADACRATGDTNRANELRGLAAALKKQ